MVWARTPFHWILGLLPIPFILLESPRIYLNLLEKILNLLQTLEFTDIERVLFTTPFSPTLCKTKSLPSPIFVASGDTFHGAKRIRAIFESRWARPGGGGKGRG